jgi:hypothetical protein
VVVFLNHQICFQKRQMQCCFWWIESRIWKISLGNLKTFNLYFFHYNRSYFGECASPDRFLDSVRAIVTANVELDSQPGVKEDPSLHFDAEAFDEGLLELFVRNNQINTVAGDGKYSTARGLLGKSLHSIQKFYSHSNWIEIGNTETVNFLDGNIGPVADNLTSTCDPDLCVDGDCEIIVDEFLTSGYFHLNVFFINDDNFKSIILIILSMMF